MALQPTEFFKPQTEIPVIQRLLLRWFRRHGRDLPWRRTRDPYAILVSEFMLQQTQVATVRPYFERWLERFPNFTALARAKEATVLHAWQGLGYYARARNLHTAAKLVMQKFGGKLPADVTLVRQLPGVGRYTAGAIASLAFDQSEPIVEANTARVLARLTNSGIPIDSSAGRDHLWRAASELVPRKNAREHNSALMDLGAILCLPRKPRCMICPVRAFCRARKPESLPTRRKRPSLLRVTESHLFARHGNQILLEHSRTRWRGMWILPRLARRPRSASVLELDFHFTRHLITLAVFTDGWVDSPNESRKWMDLNEIERLPIPTPHRRALRQLNPVQR
jgi:A/G-specific adenine glycosylase